MWNFAVWLQLVAVKAFLTPAKQLVQAQPRWKQATATLRAWAACLLRKILRDREEPALNSCTKALKEAEQHKLANVDTYLVLLALIIFGPLCPLLFIMAPIFVVANLCSINWVRTQKQDDAYLQRLADKVVAQHPTVLVSLCAVFTQWVVAIAIFIE